MAVYEVYRNYLVYKFSNQRDYEIIICKVNNIEFVHLMLLLLWIICEYHTVSSFLAYLSIVIVGWTEFFSVNVKPQISQNYLQFIENACVRLEKILNSNNLLSKAGFVSKLEAYKNLSLSSDNLEPFDRRTTEPRNKRPSVFTST
jgi:hypothetical protein